MEHAQLIQSVFVSYLIGINPSSWSEDMIGDAGLRIFAGEDGGLKDGPRIVCAVQGNLTEEPQFSGNRWAEVQVALRTPVVDDGGASLTNHRANAIALQAALMDAGLIAGLQSAALYVYAAIDRNPFQNEDADYWESGMSLRVYSLQTV
jgi:hypothetical protein